MHFDDGLTEPITLPDEARPFIFWTKLSSDAAAIAVRAMTGKGVHFRSELKLWLAFRKLEICRDMGRKSATKVRPQ